MNGAYSYYSTSVSHLNYIEHISKDGQYVIWSNDSNYKIVSKDIGSNTYVHYRLTIANTSYSYIYGSSSLISFSSDLQLLKYDLAALFSGNTLIETFTIKTNFTSINKVSDQNQDRTNTKVVGTSFLVLFMSNTSNYYSFRLASLNFKNGSWEFTDCLNCMNYY